MLGNGHGLFVVRSASGRWVDAKAEALFTTTAPIHDYAPFPDGDSFLLLRSTVPRDRSFRVILGWR